MKNLSLLVLCFFAVSGVTASGWRPNEMEIKITLHGKSDAVLLAGLHLRGDVYHSGTARMYVTPAELEQVRNAGLSYDIAIPDLNAYYKDFWTNKTHATGYSTCDQIYADMDSLQADFPALCKKTIVGKSIDNRDLCYLKITKDVLADNKKPKALFDAGIHGVEVGGPENAIHFAQDLCNKYATDTAVKNLVDSREIYIYCMVNPDGRAAMTRENANMVDCNRNYPFMGGPATQPEVKGVRSLLLRKNFAVHFSYHSGEEAVLYPWCYQAAAAVEKNIWVNLANVYKAASGYSTLVINQSYADYPTTGETIDFSYGSFGNAALTMEISTDQQPTDIAGYYTKNYGAMLKMIEYAGYGISGVVTDSASTSPVPALLYANTSFPLYADSASGDYHKYLIAGTYSVTAWANGYKPKTVTGVVVADKKATALDIALQRDTSSHSTWGYRITSVQSGTGNPYAALGPNDGVYFTLGNTNGIVIDMQDMIPDKPGTDFKVYTSGTTAYACSASVGIDGPFSALGTASTSSEFDLSKAGLANARFVKIAGNGLKLDAIEALNHTATPVAATIGAARACHSFSIECVGKSIRVRGIGDSPAHVSFFTASGRRLCTLLAANGRSQIAWRPSSNGVFIVTVSTNNTVLSKTAIIK